MLNSEALDLLMGRLGRRQATTIRAVLVQEINVAIRELERAPTKPWFLEDQATGDTTADQGYITLPDEFLMEIEDGLFEIQHADLGWITQVKVSRAKLNEETGTAVPAFPEGYAIWNNKFLLGPTPDAVYPYRFDYYKRTTAFVDNGQAISNTWLNEFFNYTTSKAMIVVARDHIQSDRLNINLSTQFKEAEDRFQREVEARRIANETLLLTNEES